MEAGRLRTLPIADHQVDLDGLASYFHAQVRKDHHAYDAVSVDLVQVSEQARTLSSKQALFIGTDPTQS